MDTADIERQSVDLLQLGGGEGAISALASGLVDGHDLGHGVRSGAHLAFLARCCFTSFADPDGTSLCIDVLRVTLFLFGGMTHMEREAASPKADIFVALVGPLTSATLGGLALWLGLDWAGAGVARAMAPEDPSALAIALRDVAEVMKPINELPAPPPNARAEQALDELARRDVEQLPVLDHDHMVGLVSRGDLVKWLTFRPASELAPALPRRADREQARAAPIRALRACARAERHKHCSVRGHRGLGSRIPGATPTTS